MDIMELDRNADFEWTTRLNRITLNFVGIWPSAHKNVCNKILSNVHKTFIFIIFFFLGVIPLTHSLVRTWGNLILTMDNLQYTISMILGTSELVILWWKKGDLLLVINMVADDWRKIKSDKERCIMIKQGQNARNLTMASYSIMSLAIIFLVGLPCFGKSARFVTNITDPVKILPFPTHYVYDKNQSPYFEITFATQVIIILIGTTTYAGVSNLLGLLIFHLCGQLENLREKLIDIQHDKYNEGMAFVVKEHIRLIKYFDVIERTFNFLLLGLLMYFSILFCLFGFSIVAILKDGRRMSMMRFLYHISTVVNIAGHTCLFCAIGEILITKVSMDILKTHNIKRREVFDVVMTLIKCEAIYYAACQYKWYKINPQKAKSIIFILIRANKPFYIRAGKIFPMTMSMFCDLMKTSASYMSVLLAMQH